MQRAIKYRSTFVEKIQRDQRKGSQMSLGNGTISALIGFLFLFPVGCKEASSSGSESGVIQVIDNSTVTVSGNDNRMDYPLSNTIDDDNATFMTTNTLSISDVKYIAYEFASSIKLVRLEMVDNYTNDYNMGDLEVQVSTDSTNGVNGTWETVATMTYSTTDFSSGDGTIQINRSNVKWLKLRMTYTGTGAYGGTPAFYLSEISFFQEI